VAPCGSAQAAEVMPSETRYVITNMDIVKAVAELALSAALVPPLRRVWLRDTVLVLAYHNVIPDDAPPGGERSLHITRSTFAEQMDLLLCTHRVVTLGEALARPWAGEPLAAITFDDAYVGSITQALPELSDRGLPATIFVSPGLLGRHCWWDQYSDPRTGELDRHFRQRGLAEYNGLQDRIHAWASASGMKPVALPDHLRIASEAEIHAITESHRVELGSHTWSHPNLTVLSSEEQLTHELAAPLRWLRERFPTSVMPVLAYPYGIHNDRVAAAAGRCGYSAAVGIGGGRLRRHNSSLFSVPRMNVTSGLRRRSFELRAGGVIS
jgi:peptidoglycan/xylan/chitin deacetylase (PgdA/CDA1 family)